MQNVDYGPLFDQYATQYPGGLEYIGSVLYDSVTITSGTDTQESFFITKQSSVNLGNLPLAGTLPDPQGFLIMSIRWWAALPPRSNAKAAAASTQTNSDTNDMVLMSKGVLSLTLENKKYGQFPLWMLPSGGGVMSTIAAEGATADPGAIIDYATNGFPDARNAYVLQQPLFIPPVTEISCIVNWGGILTLAAGNTFMMVAFDGMMVRPIQ